MTGRGTGDHTRGRGPGAKSGPSGHIPVLLDFVLEALAPQEGELYVDGTFGAGGYSRAILEAAECRLLAIDRDPQALVPAQKFSKTYKDRFSFLPGRFGEMARLVKEAGAHQLDGIVLDVGVSSMQIDEAVRGFSFAEDGPLDMRMSRRGLSAADVCNSFKETDLARIIAAFGEERRARTIARAICAERQIKPFESTLQLADLVTSVIGRRPGAARHPATKTFQALRIYVNRELDELASVLAAAESLLKPGGRLVVVSFHSFEDRIVKQFLTHRALPKSRPSRHMPDSLDEAFQPSFKLLNKRAITPTKDEQDANPRARSSRLRAAIRLDAPLIPFGLEQVKIPQVPHPDEAG